MAGYDGLPDRKFTKKQMFIIRFLAFGIILSALAYSANPEGRREVQKNQSTETITEKEQRERLQEAVDEVNKAIEDCVPGIICWGDSLTQGLEVNYPLVLSEIIRKNITEDISLEEMTNPEYEYLADEYLEDIKTPEVINMGVVGETSITITGRAGGIPYVTAEKIVIPEQCTAVELPLISADGKKVTPQNPGHCGLESITVSGVTGQLSMETDESTEEKIYWFTRMEVGDRVEVPQGTEIITYGSAHYLNYFPVIYMGTNGYYIGFSDLIKQQRSIIDHQTDHQDCFIIVGLHVGADEERKELEKAMVREYGDKYINLREYMVKSGITDANELLNAGIEATDHDKERMEAGNPPASLMAKDEFHFNTYGYELIGNLIYKRMDELGYFDELQEAVDEIKNQS
ncbi:hypothetical protein D3Z53_22350 [Lachnospiraceae bacterium]|jgi:hypothetical protein|nr:hypothetical protein [uncultured Schaedlerella sp.]MCI9152582.1 hypothetical protein [Ruminococcus sp.]NBI60713.1 hypothetical protein [Lachnospiraceae bacterium]